MPEISSHLASCLCGMVKIKSKLTEHNIHVCHCNMCRRWAGGPNFAVDCGNDIQITGEENISIYNSSDWAERGFCKLCGSHLFYRLKGNNRYMLPAGLFEKLENMKLSHQFFIDEKPDYYTFADASTNLTGAEVFAMFAASPIKPD